MAGTTFDTFLSTNVADRFFDKEGSSDFESHLRGLAMTGFAQSNLQQILAAEIEEERDWVVGEAIAEAWLSSEYSVIWPWNMERDKRTPKASLPGADLVGFYKTDDETRLITTLLKWLWPRCKNTIYQPYFDASVVTYLDSDNKAVSLYGILIRDTEANELDLKARGNSLGDSLG